MYACIHTATANPAIFDLALQFSPVIERTSEDTVAFSIAELGRLLGPPHQIASEICRAGHERNVEANLALATNVDTAILLARHVPGVTIAMPGEQRAHLETLPLRALPILPHLLELLQRWGLKTCGDLALLPESGVAERLGPEGIYLRNLARGTFVRPLRLHAMPTNYAERMELEHPLELLEPLLFLLGRALGELCRRLRSQSQAARVIEVKLELIEGSYSCNLEFPVPLEEKQSILKLLQLHLERHPPPAPVTAFTLRVEPAAPRRIQGGLFRPPAPAPDKLQITLARIAGMVGKENAGAPVLLETHRPDAFALGQLNLQPATPETRERPEALRLAFRLFRPAPRARVKLAHAAPRSVYAAGVQGSVVRAAGPWKTSGEWWDRASFWSREEWDVALDDGALYRIYLDLHTEEWYVQGVYD
ncbi:MAG: hypothetical protein ACRD6B_16530 [Bryobacteraceae bacterium]